MTMQIQRDEEEEKAPTFIPWNGEETIRIQRGEEEVEEKVPTYYPCIGLKKRYGYRETMRTIRCLVCIRIMI